jgi:hypothetical protein
MPELSRASLSSKILLKTNANDFGLSQYLARERFFRQLVLRAIMDVASGAAAPRPRELGDLRRVFVVTVYVSCETAHRAASGQVTFAFWK